MTSPDHHSHGSRQLRAGAARVRSRRAGRGLPARLAAGVKVI
jgi:hypothetical protein